MPELPRRSNSRDDVLDAVNSRKVVEAARKAAGDALVEMGVPLRRADVGYLADKMRAALADGLMARHLDG